MSDFILKDSLIAALDMAIIALEKREKEKGYYTDSALLAGWKNNLETLFDNKQLTIKDN